MSLPGGVVDGGDPVGVAVAGGVQVDGVGDPVVQDGGEAAGVVEIAAGGGVAEHGARVVAGDLGLAEHAVEADRAVVGGEGGALRRGEDLIRIYIIPTFGDLAAAKLDAELLERFYARLQRCRALCNGKASASHECRPLSSSTVRKIHFIIRGSLERAVRWRHLGVNKAALAEAPSPAPSEPDPPTAEEAALMLSEAWASDPDWGLLLWLTTVTGSRRGEVSALRWRHLDLVRGLLRIERSNAHPKAGVREKETKTRQRKTRHTRLLRHSTLLAAHRERCRRALRGAGLRSGTERVSVLSVPWMARRPWPPRTLTQRYGHLARKLRLRSTRLHSLRHYVADRAHRGWRRHPHSRWSPWATAAAVPQHSRSTRHGWTRPASARREQWPGSCHSSPPRRRCAHREGRTR